MHGTPSSTWSTTTSVHVAPSSSEEIACAKTRPSLAPPVGGPDARVREVVAVAVRDPDLLPRRSGIVRGRDVHVAARRAVERDVDVLPVGRDRHRRLVAPRDPPRDRHGGRPPPPPVFGRRGHDGPARPSP